MPFLRWCAGYQTGDVSLDFEHRTLIQRINDLEAKVGNGAMSTFLDDLYGEIQAHFSLEEGIFRSCTCPECAAHRDEHKTLLDRLRAARTQGVVDHGTRENVGEWLQTWFTHHFQTADAHMHGIEAGKPVH